MPGTPDATAYAIPTGTSIVANTIPATTSCTSHARWYSRSVTTPGSQRIQFWLFIFLARKALLRYSRKYVKRTSARVERGFAENASARHGRPLKRFFDYIIVVRRRREGSLMEVIRRRPCRVTCRANK